MKNKLRTIAVFVLATTVCFFALSFLRTSFGPNKNADEVQSQGHTVLEIGAPAFTSNRVDPKNDLWPTEVTNAAIKKQLANITNHALDVGEKKKSLNVFASTTFSGQVVAEADLVTVFEEPHFLVQRIKSSQHLRLTSDLDQLIASFGPSTLKQFALKVISLETSGGDTITRLLNETAFESNGSLQQINAIWNCTWVVEKDKPLLKSVALEQFEKVTLLRSGTEPLFQDVTRSVLEKTDGFGLQFLRSTSFWSQRLTGVDDMHIFGHNGFAIADANNDGLDDLYVCDSGGLPNRLFLQNPDGTAKDFSDASNANWLESTSSALMIDLDNDGDQDLVCATVAGVLFASNNGKGLFKIRDAFRGVPEAHSMCAADFDNDGDVDVYICNYGPSSSPGSERGFEAALPIPYDDANNGGANVLLSNMGNFKFQNVTESVGLNSNNHRFSFAAAWEDFDLDGDVDLYVANDFGRNNLYQNNGGQFQDVAAKAGVEDTAAGMSVSWADYNRDGNPDVYVGNMFSSAGNRVTYQRQFTDLHQNRSSAFQRMARGNTLFSSKGDGTFDDVSEIAGVNIGRWAWSSKFADLNNDGWQDLIVANGYFTNENPDDL